MEAFTTHTGIGVPLRRSNVDTDQIILAEYLKRVTRSGFEDGLFAAWRRDDSFILNDPSYAAGSVSSPVPDFGTGSSREHAVWALMNYGFRWSSLPVRGHLPRQLGQGRSPDGDRQPGRCRFHLEVPRERTGRQHDRDLVSRTITAGDIIASFEVDDHPLAASGGLDDIGLTLRHEGDHGIREQAAGVQTHRAERV